MAVYIKNDFPADLTHANTLKKKKKKTPKTFLPIVVLLFTKNASGQQSIQPVPAIFKGQKVTR